jgi:hypothetical protein
LGQEKQTILIRNYKTNVTEFLLYPTVSYALKDDYLDSFQDEYHEFVEENALPDRKGVKSSLNTSPVWRRSWKNQFPEYLHLNITSGPGTM